MRRWPTRRSGCAASTTARPSRSPATARAASARVGLAPGRYLIEATPPLPAGPLPAGHWFAPTASRLARVETDDLLDLRIGTDPPARFYGVGPARGPGAEATEPRPACDDPLVPPAPPLTDRYIIH